MAVIDLQTLLDRAEAWQDDDLGIANRNQVEEITRDMFQVLVDIAKDEYNDAFSVNRLLAVGSTLLGYPNLPVMQHLQIHYMNVYLATTLEEQNKQINIASELVEELRAAEQKYGFVPDERIESLKRGLDKVIVQVVKELVKNQSNDAFPRQAPQLRPDPVLLPKDPFVEKPWKNPMKSKNVSSSADVPTVPDKPVQLRSASGRYPRQPSAFSNLSTTDSKKTPAAVTATEGSWPKIVPKIDISQATLLQSTDAPLTPSKTSPSKVQRMRDSSALYAGAPPRRISKDELRSASQKHRHGGTGGGMNEIESEEVKGRKGRESRAFGLLNRWTSLSVTEAQQARMEALQPLLEASIADPAGFESRYQEVEELIEVIESAQG